MKLLVLVSVCWVHLCSGSFELQCECGSCTSSDILRLEGECQESLHGSWKSNNDGLSGICQFQNAFTAHYSCVNLCKVGSCAYHDVTSVNDTTPADVEDGGFQAKGCSDETITKCLLNSFSKNGEFVKCDMCVCESYDDISGSTGDCGADENIYNCYISYDFWSIQCQSQMKTTWIIIFSVIAVAGCCGCCACWGYACYLCCHKNTPANSITPAASTGPSVTPMPAGYAGVYAPQAISMVPIPASGTPYTMSTLSAYPPPSDYLVITNKDPFMTQPTYLQYQGMGGAEVAPTHTITSNHYL